jgi:hypothetical protein
VKVKKRNLLVKERNYNYYPVVVQRMPLLKSLKSLKKKRKPFLRRSSS